MPLRFMKAGKEKRLQPFCKTLNASFIKMIGKLMLNTLIQMIM